MKWHEFMPGNVLRWPRNSVPAQLTYGQMQETEGWQKKFLSDGLHLTTEGNAVVYPELVRVLTESGLAAEETSYDFPEYDEIDESNPMKAFNHLCQSLTNTR